METQIPELWEHQQDFVTPGCDSKEEARDKHATSSWAGTTVDSSTCRPLREVRKRSRCAKEDEKLTFRPVEHEVSLEYYVALSISKLSEYIWHTENRSGLKIQSYTLSTYGQLKPQEGSCHPERARRSEGEKNRKESQGPKTEKCHH